ncbi:MAG: hypothetical protein Q8M76_12180, partial [Spirochaetaceae bacterium]|nr:hypothetical protein [Spirochaetaceae bacterium]
MREDWVRGQDRKRQAVAYSSTLGLYGLALAGAWALGLLDPSLRSFDTPAIIINFEDSDAGEGKAILGLTKAPEAPGPTPPAPIASVI